MSAPPRQILTDYLRALRPLRALRAMLVLLAAATYNGEGSHTPIPWGGILINDETYEPCVHFSCTCVTSWCSRAPCATVALYYFV